MNWDRPPPSDRSSILDCATACGSRMMARKISKEVPSDDDGTGFDRQAPRRAKARSQELRMCAAGSTCGRSAAIRQRPSIRTINRPRGGPCDGRGCFAGSSPRVGRGRRSRIYLTRTNREVPPASSRRGKNADATPRRKAAPPLLHPRASLIGLCTCTRILPPWI